MYMRILISILQKPLHPPPPRKYQINTPGHLPGGGERRGRLQQYLKIIYFSCVLPYPHLSPPPTHRPSDTMFFSGFQLSTVTLGTKGRSPYFINFSPAWRQHSDTRFLGKEKIRMKGKGHHFFQKSSLRRRFLSITKDRNRLLRCQG